MFVDRFPLPSNVPVVFVCHWFKGSATLVLCNNTQEPPGVPFVADKFSPPVPLTWMLVMCGDDGGTTILPILMAPEALVAVVPYSAAKVAGKFV